MELEPSILQLDRLQLLKLLELLYQRTVALEKIKQSYKKESCGNLAAFVLEEYSSTEILTLINQEKNQ